MFLYLKIYLIIYLNSKTMQPILFVAFSHTLTEDQIQDFKATFGDGKIITLKEVNPKLQATFSNIDPELEGSGTLQIAAQVVEEARKVNATHFYCAGELSVAYHSIYLAIEGYRWDDEIKEVVWDLKPLTCLTSTTKRVAIERVNADGSITTQHTFKHVKWRVII